MVCHIHRYHSDVECSASVSKEEIHIVLTESGIIPTVENCGVLTRTYEVCEGHFQHLLSLNLKRSRRRLCLLSSFISSHPDIDQSIDQDIHAKSKMKRVDRTLSIDHIRVIQDKYGIVLAVNTRKLLPKPQNYSVNLPQLNIINACSIDVDFHTLGRPNPKVETAVDPVLSEIFTCETDGCVQSFNTYKELEEHHLVDKCVIIAEKHPKFQKVQLYVDKLNTAQITQRDVELAPDNVIEGQNRQAMGWALKATPLNKRFSEKQKKYLIAKFNIGLQTGNKEDPDNVAEEMKYATQNGSHMFASTDFLTPLQISSFFSRHARKTDALRETLISEVENALTTSI